eukprot:jgi/Chlat1/4703/Chrsp3S00444
MLQVHCAGCGQLLNVPDGAHKFACPKCHMVQGVPVHQQRAMPKFQVPCANTNCRQILNVTQGLSRFCCPKCNTPQALSETQWVELARNAAREQAIRERLSMLSGAGLRTNGLGQGYGGVPDYSQLAQFESLKRSYPGILDQEQLELYKRLRAQEDEPQDEEDDAEDAIGETFMEYKPAKWTIGKPHPDPVVETSSLSAVEPPDVTYRPVISDEIAETGALSALQLEAVVYACQRHEQVLPSNQRGGFFLGDGAGVGKGRTVAGLVKENWKMGRRRGIWLSVGSDLKYDASRDLEDLNAAEIPVHALNKAPYKKLDSKEVGIHDGVVFSTYSSLIASSENGRSRLSQLIQWCGKDFDGLIVFDECHKAKNLVPDSGAQPTRTGEAVLELQNKLPMARVVYCSATGASEPRNLGYMSRLGLWGPGTAFKMFSEFLSAVDKGGVGALELIAMDMKARGMYVCRTLSFAGAEFEVVNANLSAEVTAQYRESALFWAELRTELHAALESIGDGGPKKNHLWRYFWATHQRFFRHLCIAAKVPAVVELAQQALKDNKCVVIGLQSTGEARTEDVVKQNGTELEDFVSGPRELVTKFIEDYYPFPPEPPAIVAAREKAEKQERQKRRAEATSRTATRSSRGRALRGRAKYAESGDEEGLEALPSDEGSDKDTESGSDEEVIALDKTCIACGAGAERDDRLIQCTKCQVAIHMACLVPPMETRQPKWLCPDCQVQDAYAARAKEEYNLALQQRHEAAQARKAELLRVARTLQLPHNPLDLIIDQLGGPDAVAEMTGRKGLLVRNPQDGSAGPKGGVSYRLRKTDGVAQELQNMHEKQLFMDGKKLVAVISEAASAGISLQADRRVANTRRRVHITLELPWSADRAIQQFGRSHRSNQASAPQYRLLFTNLGGEKRFATVVARRLETLGALTQGDRRAGPQITIGDNYDSFWGKRALSTMYKVIMEKQTSVVKVPDGVREDQFLSHCRCGLMAAGIIQGATDIDSLLQRYSDLKFSKEDLPIIRPSGKISDNDLTDVPRFLNRLLGLPPETQNMLFSYFEQTFKLIIDAARKEGRFDAGIVDVRAASVELAGEPTVVHQDDMTTANTTHYKLNVDRGYSWEEASVSYEGCKEKGASGFWKSQTPLFGRTNVVFVSEVESGSDSGPRLVRVFRPNTGAAGRPMPFAELQEKYSKVASGEEAERMWKESYNTFKDMCLHGAKCKKGPTCQAGKRVLQTHILCGLILPMWSVLEDVLMAQDQKSQRKLRVIRLETTSDNRRIVGIHIPIEAVDRVLEGFKKLEQQQQQASDGDAGEGSGVAHNEQLLTGATQQYATPHPNTHPGARSSRMDPMVNSFSPGELALF